MRFLWYEKGHLQTPGCSALVLFWPLNQHTTTAAALQTNHCHHMFSAMLKATQSLVLSVTAFSDFESSKDTQSWKVKGFQDMKCWHHSYIWQTSHSANANLREASNSTQYLVTELNEALFRWKLSSEAVTHTAVKSSAFRIAAHVLVICCCWKRDVSFCPPKHTHPTFHQFPWSSLDVTQVCGGWNRTSHTPCQWATEADASCNPSHWKSSNSLVSMKLLHQAPHFQVNILVQECLPWSSNVLLTVYNLFQGYNYVNIKRRYWISILKKYLVYNLWNSKVWNNCQYFWQRKTH